MATDRRLVSRGRLLDDVSLALMEPAINERLGRGRVISEWGVAWIGSRIGAWARDAEEGGDLSRQADELAEDIVEVTWASIGPHVRSGAEIVVGVGDSRTPVGIGRIPAQLRPSGPREGQSRAYDVALRHRVAHGVVGAILTGRAVSVGFDGFGVEAESPGIAVRFLIAGQILDVRMAGKARTHGCACRDLSADHVLVGLGITDEVSGREGTLGERLAALGRDEEFRAYHWARWTEAAPLVDGAIGCGLLDREAARLHVHGRIVIDPSEATVALVADGDVAPAGDTAGHPRAPRP